MGEYSDVRLKRLKRLLGLQISMVEYNILTRKKMDNSRIKFRAWSRDIDSKMKMWPWEKVRRYFNNWVNDDSVLMQYTGLKDKNGKEIYEGDVIFRKLSLSETTAIVKWHQKYCCFMWIKTSEKEVKGGNWEFMDGQTMPSNIGFEVIGNIYENHELLK